MSSVLCVSVSVCVDTHTQQQYYRVSVVVLKHVGHI